MAPAVLRAALYLLCAGATFYAIFAIIAARDFFSSPAPAPDAAFHPGISVLKPIRGAEPDAEENFRSFCEQDYPDYQIVFGALDPDDPGLAAARVAAARHAGTAIAVVAGSGASVVAGSGASVVAGSGAAGVAGSGSAGANPKVANLAGMESRARHEILLISDSDVRAPGDYLRRMVAALADPAVAVATSPYRSRGRGLGGLLQALGNATEFQPSVFVARKVEGVRFGLGAGILIRREALEEIGGFAEVSRFLADDLMLGLLPARAGRRVVMALPVVDHELGHVSFAAFARRQIRWNRGIRAARPGGYAGLLWTQSTVAAILLLAVTGGSGAGWAAAAATLGSRLAMAWQVGARELEDASVRKWILIVPLRDLVAFALWLAGFFGRTVEWRGVRYRVDRGGRLAAVR
jgi:ceramide glucosyltransferase